MVYVPFWMQRFTPLFETFNTSLALLPSFSATVKAVSTTASSSSRYAANFSGSLSFPFVSMTTESHILFHLISVTYVLNLFTKTSLPFSDHLILYFLPVSALKINFNHCQIHLIIVLLFNPDYFSQVSPPCLRYALNISRSSFVVSLIFLSDPAAK